MNKVEFNGNRYTENTGANTRGIITIWGAPRVFFESEYFANNSETSSETLDYIQKYDSEITILT